MTCSSAYLLALQDVPGVGNVAATRLAEHFRTPEELLSCPREQVALRLRRIPDADKIVQRLREQLPGRCAAREKELDELRMKGVNVISLLDHSWPVGLADLERGDRPLVLFCYGPLGTLSGVRVGFFASPPLGDESFELAQLALRRLLAARELNAIPAIGATTGFDIAVARISSSPEYGRPAVMVVPGGLRKLDRTVRPTASAVVRSGGLLVSPFEMEHGLFPHDEHRRALVQAGLSDVCVFLEPGQNTPDSRALDWAIRCGKPAFEIGNGDADRRAHRLNDAPDLDWLEVAVRAVGAPAEDTTEVPLPDSSAATRA